MAIVAEVSYDDIAAGTFPATSHQQRFQQAVTQAAATLDAPPYASPKEKLQQAMDLVLTGKVQPHGDNVFTVQGSTKQYHVNGTCECPQGQQGKSKWCKHMVSIELWKRVQQRLTPIAQPSTWPERAKAHPVLTPGTPTEPTIPAQFIQELHGKQFVLYAGFAGYGP
jgi:hypothetical protein